MKSIRSFLQNESGATAVEYAMLLAALSLAIVGAMTSFSGGMGNTMNTLTSEIG